MNNKLILSIALLTGITHNSYAQVPIGRLIIVASTVTSAARFAWHAKTSKYEEPKRAGVDAFLAMGQDTGIVIGAIGTGLKTAGDWLEQQSSETRADLPEFSFPSTDNSVDKPTEPITPKEDNSEDEPFELKDLEEIA